MECWKESGCYKPWRWRPLLLLQLPPTFVVAAVIVYVAWSGNTEATSHSHNGWRRATLHPNADTEPRPPGRDERPLPQPTETAQISPHCDDVSPESPSQRSPHVGEVLSHERLHLGAKHMRPRQLKKPWIDVHIPENDAGHQRRKRTSGTGGVVLCC